VVPAPPGGGLDLFARALAEQLTIALGQTVFVVSIPGAGGLIGAQAAARATPDGYTLALIHSGLLSVQAVKPRLDLLRAFLPLARLAHSPLVVVVRADAPQASFAELIAAVRAQPGRLSYASGGSGSPSHVAVAEMAYRLRDFDAVHVPYGGATEAATALVRGDVDFQVGVLGAVLPLIAAGRLRALAVTSGQRIGALPDLPTVAEAALPGFSIEPWSGLAMPAGAPADVAARIGEVLPRALDAAPMHTLSRKLGFEIAHADAASFARKLARELDAEKLRVKRLGIVPTP
jgi:tripartite-type tricarboxylate transporter receptor subunit TctC